MDNLYVDWAEENGISDWLLDWFMERSIACARAYCRAGCDVIFLGDDVGTQRDMMMSVEMWREHLKPRLKKVIDAVRATQTKQTWIAYHSDGNIQRILPELIEIGVDILNPVQPECMPLDKVFGEYKDRIGFWGAIGTQTTLPFGSPADIVAAVRLCADWVKRGAAIMVSPTHVIEPDVPWANVQALVDAVKAVRFEWTAAGRDQGKALGISGGDSRGDSRRNAF
jgi:uroporphyrinogen decarboxylase